MAIESLLAENDRAVIIDSIQICGSWIHIVDTHLAPGKLTADQNTRLSGRTGKASNSISSSASSGRWDVQAQWHLMLPSPSTVLL